MSDNKEISVRLMKTEAAHDLPLPSYQTAGSAGLDLYAAVDEEQLIPPGEIKIIPAGIKIALPQGLEAQIRPRSGLAAKYGVTMVNAPGTIDADYRGEIRVVLINLGKSDFTVKRGDRIAQMVIARAERAAWVETDIEDDTARGSGGFGSTGM